MQKLSLQVKIIILFKLNSKTTQMTFFHEINRNNYLQKFQDLNKEIFDKEKISFPLRLANRCKYHRPILLFTCAFCTPTISPIMPYNTPICQTQRLIEVSITGQHRHCRRTTAPWHGICAEREKIYRILLSNRNRNIIRIDL